MRPFNHSSGEYLQADDAKIYYEVTGSETRPVLLVMHGGFGILEDFNVILPELEREFKVIGIEVVGRVNQPWGNKRCPMHRCKKMSSAFSNISMLKR